MRLLGRQILFLLIILILFPEAACADGRVLFIPKGGQASFWDIMRAGALQAGKDLGLEVVVRGPSGEHRHNDQGRIIEYGIRDKFDVIVLAPNHESATAAVLERAVAEGIGLVLVDSGMQSDLHSTLIQSDNAASGRMAADYLAGLINNEGKVILARHIDGHASTRKREDAFRRTLESAYPEIEIVADPFIGASMGEAYRVVADILEREESVSAIFSDNEEATRGILQVITEKGLADRPRFIGFDYNPAIYRALLGGYIDATFIQNPYRMGYVGVSTALQLIQGRKVPKRIFTEISLVTRENIESPEIRELINLYKVTSE